MSSVVVCSLPTGLGTPNSYRRVDCSRWTADWLSDTAAHLDIDEGSSHHMNLDVLRYHKVSVSGCHGSLLKNWNNNALMLLKNFCGVFKQKVKVFDQELLPEMKSGFTTMNRKRREGARNDRQSNPNDASLWVKVSFWNIAMLDPHTARATVATIEDFHLQHLPHPPHPPCLVPSDFRLFWRLKQSLGGKTWSGPMKSRLCKSGYTREQANYISVYETKHFIGAGGRVQNAMVTESTNDTTVFDFLRIYYKKYWFSFQAPSYFASSPMQINVCTVLRLPLYDLW